MKRLMLILTFLICAFAVKAQRYDNGIILQSLTDTLIRNQPIGTHITLLDSGSFYILNSAQLSGTSLQAMITAGDAVYFFNDSDANTDPLYTAAEVDALLGGYLQSNQTITLSGDVTGSGSTAITTTVTNDSHTHDTRYFTETESDARYLQSFTETDPVYSAWNKSTGISIPASQVSDFDAEVANNTAVTANTAKVGITTQQANDITANNAKVSYPGSASATELNYLVGTTSGVQTQLNGKQATLVSGTNIKTINSESLLGSGNIVVSGGDVSGKADTTWVHEFFFHKDSISTEEIYTAAEVDALRKIVVLQSYTANTTLALTDAGKTLLASHATALSITVPPESSVAFPVGTFINVIATGAGAVTFVEGSTVTINSEGNFLEIAAQNAAATLVKTDTNVWYLMGRLQ